MAKIELKHVTKIYDDKKAVDDFNLTINDKEFIIFVGPSGCGKSTTLRMIAGLEEITTGELLIDGKRMNEVSASERNIAMVFQNYALYPHMTVRNNIAYSLKVNHVPKAEIKEKVERVAQILGLTELLDRKPGQLSGGQKQRVAMGRAMVRNPKIFLMDEPLSNLDAKLRGQMRVEIANLYHQLDSTFIYVTHDQVEAMTLGTKIVVMKDGVIQQIDTPENLFHKPANQFVAGFIGTPPMNFLDGKLTLESGHVLVNTNGIKLTLSEKKVAACEEHNLLGQNVIIGIRPANIEILSGDADECRCIKGKVEVYEMLGEEANVHIRLEKQDKVIIVRTVSKERYDVGQTVGIRFLEEHIHIFDAKTGATATN